MPKYVVKQPKNQRPMINDSYTASVKKKMGVAFLPFIIGALALVFAMGAGIEDKAVRLIVLLVGLVLFLFGIIVILKSTKDLKDYANAYWEKEDQKKGTAAKVKEEPREKITWAQAKAEYQAEAKATAQEASRLMAEKFVQAEQQGKKANQK